MPRSSVKFVIAFVLVACAHAAPAMATPPTVVYVSSTGNDTNANTGCTAAAPCATFATAINTVGPGGQISCLNAPGVTGTSDVLSGNANFTIDCFGSLTAGSGSAAFTFEVATAVKIRHLTFSGAGGATSAILIQGSGSLFIEDCVFENFAGGPSLVIEPTGPFNLVIRNTRISNGAAGILIKPSSGGNVNANLDHVTIVENAGGGVHTDSSNGAVTVDVHDSIVSYNVDNGFAASNGGGGQNNLISIADTTIGENGLAGISVSGGDNVQVLVSANLFGQNINGATSISGSAFVGTFGNNRYGGVAGSGFNGTGITE
jgi:hypothetical protein